MRSEHGAQSFASALAVILSLMAPAMGARARAAELPISAPASAPRPNFIVINLDDTRFDGIDRMPVLQTRFIPDAVAFPDSFVPLSLCCPSRASLFTGLYALHHGTRTIKTPLGGAPTFRASGADRETIAVWLHAAGYRTGLFGKYLNEYAMKQPDGPTPDTYYVPPGWDRWRAMTSPEEYGGVNGATYALIDEHGRKTVYDDHSSDAQYSTDLLAEELRRFIAETAPSGQPFFAVYTPYASHSAEPGVYPITAVRHAHAFADLPPARPPSWNEPDASDKPQWVRSQLLTGFSPGVLDAIRIAAYRSLLAVDEQLDRILDQLVALGIDQDTVIIFTSDNGVTWGEHRLSGQAKECPYEECIRVPFIFRYPRELNECPANLPGPVLNIDIAPTVAALAGITPPVPVDGEDIWPRLAGETSAWRHDFLLEHWRALGDDFITYKGQVSDGDQLRLLYGPVRAQPRASILFEFDTGDGVSAGAIAVPIGRDADETFARLAALVAQQVPAARAQPRPALHGLAVFDQSGQQDGGMFWVVEVDQKQMLRTVREVPTFFGVRDTQQQTMYVEYETGEVELYDLAQDPFELDNRAADPAYESLRRAAAARVAELLSTPVPDR